MLRSWRPLTAYGVLANAATTAITPRLPRAEQGHEPGLAARASPRSPPPPRELDGRDDGGHDRDVEDEQAEVVDEPAGEVADVVRLPEDAVGPEQVGGRAPAREQRQHGDEPDGEDRGRRPEPPPRRPRASEAATSRRGGLPRARAPARGTVSGSRRRRRSSRARPAAARRTALRPPGGEARRPGEREVRDALGQRRRRRRSTARGSRGPPRRARDPARRPSDREEDRNRDQREGERVQQLREHERRLAVPQSQTSGATRMG